MVSLRFITFVALQVATLSLADFVCKAGQVAIAGSDSEKNGRLHGFVADTQCSEKDVRYKYGWCGEYIFGSNLECAESTSPEDTFFGTLTHEGKEYSCEKATPQQEKACSVFAKVFACCTPVSPAAGTKPQSPQSAKGKKQKKTKTKTSL